MSRSDNERGRSRRTGEESGTYRRPSFRNRSRVSNDFQPDPEHNTLEHLYGYEYYWERDQGNRPRSPRHEARRRTDQKDSRPPVTRHGRPQASRQQHHSSSHHEERSSRRRRPSTSHQERRPSFVYGDRQDRYASDAPPRHERQHRNPPPSEGSRQGRPKGQPSRRRGAPGGFDSAVESSSDEAPRRKATHKERRHHHESRKRSPRKQPKTSFFGKMFGGGGGSSSKKKPSKKESSKGESKGKELIRADDIPPVATFEGQMYHPEPTYSESPGSGKEEEDLYNDSRQGSPEPLPRRREAQQKPRAQPPYDEDRDCPEDPFQNVRGTPVDPLDSISARVGTYPSRLYPQPFRGAMPPLFYGSSGAQAEPPQRRRSYRQQAAHEEEDPFGPEPTTRAESWDRVYEERARRERRREPRERRAREASQPRREHRSSTRRQEREAHESAQQQSFEPQAPQQPYLPEYGAPMGGYQPTNLYSTGYPPMSTGYAAQPGYNTGYSVNPYAQAYATTPMTNPVYTSYGNMPPSGAYEAPPPPSAGRYGFGPVPTYGPEGYPPGARPPRHVMDLRGQGVEEDRSDDNIIRVVEELSSSASEGKSGRKAKAGRKPQRRTSEKKSSKKRR